MTHIFLPSRNAEDWKRLLPDSEKQWQPGFSARTLAYCWQAAPAFPPEVARLFLECALPALQEVELLMAFPEYQVGLPPLSGHPSQNDLFVLAKASDGHLVTVTVEGKVAESFGPTLKEWQATPTKGKGDRLAFLLETLGLAHDVPPGIRYQLLHRTVSALVQAARFNARYAAMIVHSFSQSDQGFEDYKAFLRLFDATASAGSLTFLKNIHRVDLLAGWAKGDATFLKV